MNDGCWKKEGSKRGFFKGEKDGEGWKRTVEK